MQWGLDLPEEPTLPLTPSTYVRENGALAVFSLFLFNRLLHGRVVACFPAQAFVRLGSQCVLKNWLAIEPFARLETDASYTFNCWKSFGFSKMIFLSTGNLGGQASMRSRPGAPASNRGATVRVSRGGTVGTVADDMGSCLGLETGPVERVWFFLLFCFVF